MATRIFRRQTKRPAAYPRRRAHPTFVQSQGADGRSLAFFPFSGWKESFSGTLHVQSGHGVEFYTQIKVVVERWLKGWSRKF